MPTILIVFCSIVVLAIIGCGIYSNSKPYHKKIEQEYKKAEQDFRNKLKKDSRHGDYDIIISFLEKLTLKFKSDAPYEYSALEKYIANTKEYKILLNEYISTGCSREHSEELVVRECGEIALKYSSLFRQSLKSELSIDNTNFEVSSYGAKLLEPYATEIVKLWENGLMKIIEQNSPEFLTDCNSKAKVENSDNELLKSFDTVYYQIVSDIKMSKIILSDANIEVIPFLATITDQIIASFGGDRQCAIKMILEKYLPIITSNSDYKTKDAACTFIDRRMDLYGKIIRGELKPRYEWNLFNEIPQADIYMKSFSALCDILVNPACADNYENAPVCIHGLSELMQFSIIALESIYPNFSDYCLTVYSITENLL